MKEQWNSKLGFLVAAIGSAVGLGNLWRFPYIAGTNGGGAFLIPYFCAIITAGIPILIMEYEIGKKFRGGAPVAFARMNKKWEWMGWLQVGVAFMIIIYYFAIVVWTLKYLMFAFTAAWGSDPTTFFLDFIGLTDSPMHLGGLQMNLLVPFLIVWALAALIMFQDVSKGIELACKICMPLLFVLTCVLVIRGITLPGATDGLEYMFKPDWSMLTHSGVWVAAYGQIFFSLSIAFGIMISYANYLPDDEDVVNSAFITATANHGFEVFAAIGVFSIIGFMAGEQGVPVEEVARAGVGLAFMTFPTAINTLPALNGLVGVCFFGALFVAAITSLVSIIQAVIPSLQVKFEWGRKKAVAVVMLPAFLISFVFITGAGMYILDIVDAYTNQIGITVGGVLEVLFVGWFYNTEQLRRDANEFSNFHVGKWWTYCLKYVTVIVLGVMTFLNTKNFIVNGYDTYDNASLLVYGWGCLALIAVAVVVFTLMKGKTDYVTLSEEAIGALEGIEVDEKEEA